MAKKTNGQEKRALENNPLNLPSHGSDTRLEHPLFKTAFKNRVQKLTWTPLLGDRLGQSRGGRTANVLYLFLSVNPSNEEYFERRHRGDLSSHGRRVVLLDPTSLICHP